jgi:RNA polymerase subunit RPABC4/transcription elongation factor Spt4
MAKIIWSCQHCGTVMPLWQMKCPNCHKQALSWLHVIAGAVVIVPAVFLLIKLL